MTDFQRRVLRETLKIPLGETITYKELACRCGKPKACRAVANALAKNPWPLTVPCHRVTASGNKMGGYSGPGGVKAKKALLALEKSIRSALG